MESFHKAQTKKKSFFLPSFAYFSSVIQFIVLLCRRIHCCMVTMMQENGKITHKPTHTHKKYGLGSFTVNDKHLLFSSASQIVSLLGVFSAPNEKPFYKWCTHVFYFLFQPFWMTVWQKNMIQKRRLFPQLNDDDMTFCLKTENPFYLLIPSLFLCVSLYVRSQFSVLSQQPSIREREHEAWTLNIASNMHMQR